MADFPNLNLYRALLDSNAQEEGSLHSELTRRLVMNGTSIDADGLLHLGSVSIDSVVNDDVSANTLNLSGAVYIDAMCSMVANGTANVVNFISDKLTIGSPVTLIGNLTIQGGFSTGLQFSSDIDPTDVRLVRTYIGQLSAIGTSGGGLSINATDEAAGRILMGNDGAGLGFGNGTDPLDAFFSLLAPKHLALGAGYGDTDGALTTTNATFTGTLAANIFTSNSAVVNNAITANTLTVKLAHIGNTISCNVVAANIANIVTATVGTLTFLTGDSANGIFFDNGNTAENANITHGYGGSVVFQSPGGFYVQAGAGLYPRIVCLTDGGDLRFGPDNAPTDIALSRTFEGTGLAIGQGYGDRTGFLACAGDLTGNIGGAPLTAGQANTTTVTVNGAVEGDSVLVTPTFGDPGAGFHVRGYVSSDNTVTVVLSCAVAGTPTNLQYAVRVVK